jgi:hypothetical protein
MFTVAVAWHSRNKCVTGRGEAFPTKPPARGVATTWHTVRGSKSPFCNGKDAALSHGYARVTTDADNVTN